MNIDGASVNAGIHNWLGALIKRDAQLLQVIHCFNHVIELALKDAVANTAFQNIKTFLSELYFLYKSSPKQLKEFQRIGEAYGTTVPKSTNAYGTRWLNHIIQAMLIALENYGILLNHIESLLQTDSQHLR